MLLLGLDIGTSSIKASVVDAANQQCLATTQYPEVESGISSLQPGWAEQSPEMWWRHVQAAILQLHSTKKYAPSDIGAIGIAYQMHGLVCIDKDGQLVRDSIIWCDSRAVAIGNKAFEKIGKDKSLSHLLNSPGNFTASKLAWVKENEPDKYDRIHKIMLPGDFIAMKLTGQLTTSVAALSEGIFWDFNNKQLSDDVFAYYGFDRALIPVIQDVFAEHGRITEAVAKSLSLKAGIPVTYKAGDQPNNALSLNVTEPGEVAATAGTSGVIYAITDELVYDPESRVNSFAHVNHNESNQRIGVLLNINGTGILNRWLRNITGDILSYERINDEAAKVEPGSKGIRIFPFGNGAERMLNNQVVNAQIEELDFNIHGRQHLYRAAQEGIAFAFRYGLDIMRSNGIYPKIIRAGKANMFLSNVFTQAFVNTTATPVELYEGDGSVGAAIGAGIGTGVYRNADEAFRHRSPKETIEVDSKKSEVYDELYEQWKQALWRHLNKLTASSNN